MLCCEVLAAGDKPQRPTEHRIEPAGRIIEVDGVEYKAFTLKEWKLMAHLILDYHLLWDYSLSLELEIRSFGKEIELWQLRVEIWKEATEEQRARGDMLSTMFDEEHALRLSLEKRQRALGWVPWALVVVESIAIGILGVYSGAQLAAVN